jgi:hypothetical protein
MTSLNLSFLCLGEFTIACSILVILFLLLLTNKGEIFIFLLSAHLLFRSLSYTQNYTLLLWLITINYLDIACFFERFSLYVLCGSLIASVEYAIDSQSKIILVEL